MTGDLSEPLSSRPFPPSAEFIDGTHTVRHRTRRNAVCNLRDIFQTSGFLYRCFRDASFFRKLFPAKRLKYQIKCGNEDNAVAQDTQRRNLVVETETTAVGVYAAEV